MKKLIILLLLSVSTLLKAQNPVQHKVDSLLNVLKTATHDSVRAKANYKLAMAYWGNDFNNTLVYANKALVLYEKIGNLKKQGSSLDAISGVYYSLGQYDKALEFNKKSIAIRIKMKDTPQIGASYNNRGEIYRVVGNYPEALKNYFIALKYNEKCGSKEGLGYAYSNIGVIYEYQGNYKDALINYRMSLKYREQINDRYGIASCLSNIAGANSNNGNYDEAIKETLKAAKIFEEIGNLFGLSNSYYRLGEYFKSKLDRTEALKYLKMSQELREKLEDKEGLCITYNSIGSLYLEEGKFNEAKPILIKALKLAEETGGLLELKESHENLSSLFKKTNDIKKSYYHYEKFILYRDSLFNNENVKKMTQTQMQYDFEKKEAQALSLQQKKDAVAKEEFRRLKQMRNGFIGGFTVVMIFAFVFFNQKNKIKKEKKKSDELLLNILPHEVAEELKEKGSAEAQLINEVTILFTDFKGFTQLSEKLTPKELVGEINECFSAFDRIMEKNGVEKIKTIGDAYMAAGGLPTSNTTHANDIINAALAIQRYMDEHIAQKKTEGKLFFEIRIGVHSGPVVAGIVGVKKFAYDIWGDTVNTASRMESSGETGKVNISGTTYELVKDKFACTHRGKILAKGKGELDMYFVEGRI